MKNPHEQQAAAMSRVGELQDGEQLSSECLDCGGTGMRDSGGFQPWGEAISVPCDCGAQHIQAAADQIRSQRAIDQLRECINSGQVSAAQAVAHAENGEVTGWPAGMLQDECRGLSKALSRDPNARALVRDAAIAIERFEPDHDSNGSYMAFYLDGNYVRHSDHITALAAERAEVARLTGLLKNIRTVHSEWFGNEISSETAITYIGMYIAEDAAAPGEKHD